MLAFPSNHYKALNGLVKAAILFSAYYAAEHPFCELCFERGIIVPTEEIHHKLPLSEGGMHDRRNLIALCKSCHSTIHAKRGDYWGNHRG